MLAFLLVVEALLGAGARALAGSSAQDAPESGLDEKKLRTCHGPLSLFCPDSDGDGYGSDDGKCFCRIQTPDGYGAGRGDCDDADADVHPNVTEVCNQKDDDCDGLADEDAEGVIWYRDADGDGFGDADTVVKSCAGQPPGYVSSGDDCDDSQSSVSPEGRERCDGLDNNCDGSIDEGLQHYFPDADGDGFGAMAGGSCLPAQGLIQVRGDCDDTDPAVHPGAADAGGGVDQDCGGTAGPEPSVGLGGGLSLQSAIDQAASGVTVWVGPGVYLEHDLMFRGKSLTLISTHFAAQTVVNAEGMGHGFLFDAGEGPDTVVDGFTVTNGSGGPGGGMLMLSSSPTILNSVFEANMAYPGNGYLLWAGGGVAMFSSSARLIGCTFTRNQLLVGPQNGRGAALYLNNSNAYIADCVFSDNVVEGQTAAGGAIYLEASSPVIQDCVFTGNEARGETASGGAIFMSSSHPRIEGCIFRNNRAVGFTSYNAAQGGALFLVESNPVIENCLFEGNYVSTNVAQGNGGALFLNGSSPVLTHCRIVGSDAQLGGALYLINGSSPSLNNSVLLRNQAWGGDYFGRFPGRGGAIAAFGASLTLSQVTMVGNIAVTTDDSGSGYIESEGGGLFMSDGALVIERSILAYNSSCNVYVDAVADGSIDVRSSGLYTDGDCNHNLAGLDGSNLLTEPGFLAYDETSLPRDLHLALDSPLVNLGGGGEQDLDGTAADPGAFGGLEGGAWDLDRDGAFNWFWPGAIGDAPTGFAAADFDCDDADPAIAQGCSG